MRIRDKTIHPTPVISSSCSAWQTDIKIQVLDWAQHKLHWKKKKKKKRFPFLLHSSLPSASVLPLRIVMVFYHLLSARKELKNECWRLDDTLIHLESFAFRMRDWCLFSSALIDIPEAQMSGRSPKCTVHLIFRQDYSPTNPNVNPFAPLTLVTMVPGCQMAT